MIKRPDLAVHGIDLDHFRVGETYEISPALAWLMIAAGWVCRDLRRTARRYESRRSISNPERRRPLERRVAHA